MTTELESRLILLLWLSKIEYMTWIWQRWATMFFRESKWLWGQRQNLATHISSDNIFPMVDQTPQTKKLRLGQPCQRSCWSNRSHCIPTTSIPSVVSTIQANNNERTNFRRQKQKFWFLWEPFSIYAWKTTRNVRTDENFSFPFTLPKKDLKTIRNKNSSKKREHLKTYSSFFDENSSDHNHEQQQNTSRIPSLVIPTRNHYQIFKNNECSERAFGLLAQQMIDSLPESSSTPHLKRSINPAYLESGKYGKIVAHLERELKFRWLETDGKLPIFMMATTTSTGNKRNQSKDSEQQQKLCQ